MADSLQKQIQERAYSNYLSRGGKPGSDLDDWLKAEQEVKASSSSASSSNAMNGSKKKSTFK